MAGDRFFTDEENMAELVGHMSPEDAHRYNKYGHNRVESAFVDRVFIVYKPEGLTMDKQHRAPTVLATIKVVDFSADHRNGAVCVVEDMVTHQLQTLTHVPKKILGFPVYVSLPTRLQMRWDARDAGENRVWRSLSFALLVKSKNKADFYSKGNTYMTTPNEFRRLYPSVTGVELPFKF